jgi:hypothetical protein
MNKQARFIHLLVAASLGLLLFCCLQPVTAAAQSLAPPLPLPYVTIYGAVVQDGVVLTGGTVKALLPDGAAVSAPIGPIRGGAYNYALKIPLFMTATTTLPATGAGILTGDAVAFFVDNRPAFYRDAASELTMSELAIRAQGAARTAAGRTYEINLTMAGAETYPLGDVNATGVRNSADAMLALKYDIGLILGVTAFPPGPNTVYLPLCDIVENGRCDSSDALRILQCDVGISGIACPADRIPARAQTQQAATAGAALSLRPVVTAEVEPDTVVVQVEVGDPTAQFGAATLELDYDPALFAVLECTENPAGALDLVSCNDAYAPGVVRFSGIAAAGGGDGASLVAVRFTRLAATPADLNTLFALRADGVFDQAGEELAWNDGAAPPAPDADGFKVFMPAVAGPGERTEAPAADGTEAPSPLPALSYLVHLPVIGAQAEGGTAIEAVTETEVATETEAVTATTDTAPASESTPTPAPAPTDTGSDLPPPTATPVADLPPKEQGDGADDGQRLYLPLIAED